MGRLFTAAVLFAFAISLAFSEVNTTTPISSTMDNTRSSYEFFKTDVFGRPTLYVVADPGAVVLSPPGGVPGNLPNNAVVCPSNFSMRMSNLNVKWAATFFNGSAAYPTIIADPGRNWLPPLPGNPATRNANILFSSLLANELQLRFNGGQTYITRAAGPIYNAVVTDVPQNSRFFRLRQPVPCPNQNCTLSAEARTALICGGKVIISSPSPSQIDITGTDTSLPLGSYGPNQDFTVTAKVRLDPCIGVINDWPEMNNNVDTKILFAIQNIPAFPTDSGDATLNVQVRNPTGTGSVISANPAPPYQLGAGQSIDVDLTVFNSQSSILDLQVTGIVALPPAPPDLTVAIIGPNPPIPAGQSRVIRVRITQSNPAYTSAVNFAVLGNSTAPTCNNQPLNWSITWPNVPLSSGAFCMLSPNPVLLRPGGVNVTANCFLPVAGSTPVPISCTALNWSATSPAVIIIPSQTPFTPLPNNPRVFVNFTAQVPPGGLIIARGTDYNCSAQIICGPVSCTLTSDLQNNRLSPPNSANFNASCLQNGVRVPCPMLQWSTNLQGTGFNPANGITPILFTPSMQLTTDVSTPVPQTGSLWANGTDYCSAVSCVYPLINVTNATCLTPCVINMPSEPVQLSTIGQQIRFGALCFSNPQMSNTMACPSGTWGSNAGSFSPNPSPPGNIQAYSNLTVARINGTYASFNYSGPGGIACACAKPLLPVLPDYVPVVQQNPAGPVQIGQTVFIDVATSNIGGVDAVNITQTSVQIPTGNERGPIRVLPLSAGGSTSMTRYTFVCDKQFLYQYTANVNLNRQFDQTESDYANNNQSRVINCGNVKVCEDYI